MNNTDNELKSITKQIRQSTSPQRGSGCKNAKCKPILKEALAGDEMIVDSSHVFLPLQYHKFLELCCLCQNNLCDIWNDHHGQKRRVSLELFKLDMELSEAIYALAHSKGQETEIKRKWCEDIYRRLELRGMVFDRAYHPLYDIMGTIS